MIEETLELIGYLVIAVASVEAALQLRAPARAVREAAAPGPVSPAVVAFPYDRRTRPHRARPARRPVNEKDAV
ncbi:MAG TPA: hypothetical protein VIL43_06565 [Burkholderiales bacterium]